ncbi:hypothetical protein CRG98_004019 [Punica granatum]|uniref:Uncharacterized protein n=1 Tax=Punica granatum TaxID=22663 RepID=A0A2I0L4K2_PUNGR|nr:hypothetical protein CRG98_004019 [Punica granatum]
MERQGVRGPSPQFLLGNIPDMASLVSKSTSCGMDSIRHDIVDRLLPHYVLWSKQFGLLMANGSDWYHQRHMVAPVFMGDRLKSYAGYMVECTNEIIQSLENAVSAEQTEVEIGEYMTRLTANIISRTEFGSSYAKGKQIFHLLTVLQGLCAQASRHLCLPGSR